MKLKSAILIFAKAPLAGLVKTRLIPFVGEQNAAKLHQAMVVQSVSVAARCQSQNCDLQLWCTPDTSHELFKNLQRDVALSLHEQTGDHLGVRMHRAFQQALSEHDQAIIIGTDCPTISHEILEQAFHTLKTNDAVIAPAEDGGYVLIGLKKAAKELFTGIPWGTGNVFNLTVNRFRSIGFTWKELPVQWDVDRPQDLQRLIAVYRELDLISQLRLAIAGLESDNDMCKLTKANTRR
jgi:rSAM/selenodomain-associated transferase 1